jgi:hypothetical protein
LLEGFDIHLFSFTMCSEFSESMFVSIKQTNIPLCLSVELLSSGQGWFAVRLGTSPLRRLPICAMSAGV